MVGFTLLYLQRQRVAIARAFAREEHIRIMLLDEVRVCTIACLDVSDVILQPTSALDQASEQLIQDALDKIMHSGTAKTSVVVAHRLSTIQARAAARSLMPLTRLTGRRHHLCDAGGQHR